MTLRFTVEKEDHLAYQLFQASQSDRIKKKRRRNWLMVPVLYLIFGGILYFIQDKAYLVTFAAVAAVWFAGYPFYSRWQYKRHYTKHIEEHLGQTLGRETTLTLEEESLYLKDLGGEGRIKLTELTSIYDIPQHVFIILNNGNGVILPRKRIQDRELDAFITRIEEKTDIKRDVLDWKWI